MYFTAMMFSHSEDKTIFTTYKDKCSKLSAVQAHYKCKMPIDVQLCLQIHNTCVHLCPRFQHLTTTNHRVKHSSSSIRLGLNSRSLLNPLFKLVEGPSLFVADLVEAPLTLHFSWSSRSPLHSRRHPPSPCSHPPYPSDQTHACLQEPRYDYPLQCTGEWVSERKSL